jgi:transcriptional regulator with XRE-family HTH domain
MAGMTQFDLAKQSGIGRTRVSLAECGHIELSSEEHAAIQRALVDAIRNRAAEFGGVLSRSPDLQAFAQ